MPMQLPVEIIGRIIQLIYLSTSKRKAILPLLLVSPTFRIETERLLYSHICLRTLPQVVRCFQTINARPNIPRTVRQLHVSITLNSALPAAGLFDFISLDGTVLNDEQVLRMREARAAKHTGKVLRPFGALVNRTLNKLTSLQEYSLSLGSAPGRDELAFAPMWLPAQAPFKLRRFIVDLNLSPAMTRFLQSQSSITDLLAPHFYNQPGRLPLPKGSLPKLRGLVLSPEAAGSIVPGRPVKRVVLKPSGQRGAPRMIDAITNAIPSLAKSTVPVKSIDVMAPQIPDVTESLLKPLAAGLPNLEHIALRRPFIFPDEHVYDVYESDAFSATLAEFPNLKTLQLPAPPPHHHLREAGIINEMVEPFPGAPLTIQANINGQIFTGPVPPAPPPPVVFGPPLPPNFHHPNGHNEDDQADAPPAGEGGGAGAGGLQGLGGGFFAIPLGGGGFFGGGMLPPLPAGPPAGNAPQPPAAGPGGGGLPNFFQNLFGFNQPPANQNANDDPDALDAAPAPQPPAPAQNQGIGLDLANVDDAPPLMDDPGDGEVVADFFVVTAGPMPGEEGGNGDGNDVDPADPQPQPPQQADENPLPAQPGAANAGPAPPPLFNLNQVLNQATNMIIQQLQNQIQAQLGGIHVAMGGLGGPAPGGVANPNPAPAGNANPGAAPAAHTTPLADPPAATDPAEPDLAADILLPEPLDEPQPAGAGEIPPPPPGHAPPMNFQTTFITAFNPQTGEMVVDAGADGIDAAPQTSTRRRDYKDPKVIEVLDKGQRGLKDKEQKILDKWKMGGYAPNLKSVVFEMDQVTRRRTVWSWKGSKPAAPQPTSSRLTTVSDGDDDGDVQIRNADDEALEVNANVGGMWDVEYVHKGVYTSQP